MVEHRLDKLLGRPKQISPLPSGRPERFSISDGQWNCSTLCIQIVEGVGDIRVSVCGRVHEPLWRVDLLG